MRTQTKRPATDRRAVRLLIPALILGCAGAPGDATPPGPAPAAPPLSATATTGPMVSPAVRAVAEAYRPRLAEAAGDGELAVAVALGGAPVWTEGFGPDARNALRRTYPLRGAAALLARAVGLRFEQDGIVEPGAARMPDAPCPEFTRLVEGARRSLARQARAAVILAGGDGDGIVGPCTDWTATATDLALFGAALLSGRLLEDRFMEGANWSAVDDGVVLLVDPALNVVVAAMSAPAARGADLRALVSSLRNDVARSVGAARGPGDDL